MTQHNPRRGKISKKRRNQLNMRCGHGDCKYASTMAGGMCDYLDMTGRLRAARQRKIATSTRERDEGAALPL